MQLASEGGLTGSLVFDDNGRRSLRLSVISFRIREYVRTHEWNYEEGVKLLQTADSSRSYADTLFQSKNFIVTTKLVSMKSLMNLNDNWNFINLKSKIGNFDLLEITK